MLDATDAVKVVFAVDDRYIPFLAVAIESLVEHSSKDNYYLIKILHTDVSSENKKKIEKYKADNISIEFVDLNYYLQKVKDKLYTRDYYTNTTYFRLFLPELYPQYNKVLYLDSDIVILDDIANLYNINMGDNLVAAAPDDIIQSNKVFQDYVEKVVGVSDYKHYFNAGVLLMNLDQLRKFNFQEKFVYLLSTIKFSVAQDQDYLNRLCKGRVKLLSVAWDRMPIPNDKIKDEDIKILHFNFACKPWHFEDVLYKEFFWEYAKKTEFYNDIIATKENYTEEERFRDRESEQKLRELAQKEADCVGDDRKKLLDKYLKNLSLGSDSSSTKTEKSKDRIEVLKKIEELEKEGKFDIDVEDDPPTVVLSPENVDYLKKKSYSKIKTRLANKMGEKFLNDLLKENKLIIKKINGIENLQNVKSGAMLTCNHFNPFDSFAIEKAFRTSGVSKHKKLYKVIREGNYTNFPGLYGFFFRNCDTLPLSSNRRTMIEFVKAVDTILKRGDFILIYPEQSLWWNYRKPKPLKNGGFKLAARNKVPIIPIFITMEDSNILGEDGFPVQEYTINIEKPIYPDENLNEKQNAEIMKNKNYEVWKKVYEDFYKIPLEYSCEENVKK